MYIRRVDDHCFSRIMGIHWGDKADNMMTTPNQPAAAHAHSAVEEHSNRRTPLYDAHVKLGAKMAGFGGWDVPIQYSGIINEHNAVRERCGLFDVSHMGEIFFEGPGALETLQKLTTNDLSRIIEGQALYTVCCNPDGGILDDLVIYNMGGDRYMACVNAATRQKDLSWFLKNAERNSDCTITDRSDDFGQVALQGRLAQEILGELVDDGIRLEDIAPFHFATGTVAGISNTIISRTGYTGEDGFELYIPAKSVGIIWDTLLAVGGKKGLIPCGFGARDSLRLEMKYCLYGNDIDETTTPLEAGLAWLVKFAKGDFIGKSALEVQKQGGVNRRLVGLEVKGRSAARHENELFVGDEKVGHITSGAFSPSLGKPIAMAYVDAKFTQPETALEVEIRGKRVPVKIVKTPFYKRPY